MESSAASACSERNYHSRSEMRVDSWECSISESESDIHHHDD